MTTELTVETVHRACERLSEVFGARFSLWTREGHGWTAEAAASQDSPELTGLLDQVVEASCPEPRLLQPGCGRSFLATVFRGPDGARGLLCGEVTLTAESLARQLYLTTVKRTLVENESEQQSLLLNDYSSRMIDSLEEMTFLRRLTHHLEYCDATRSLRDVAVAVLPQLRQLMQVEALGLIASTVEENTDRGRAAQTVHEVGVPNGSAYDWCRLVNEQTRGHSGIVVRNADNDLHGAWSCGIAGIHSLVIAPVVNDGALFGWLVGLNKLPPEPDNGMLRNSLSNREIGSVETTLLEAAAAMFASHATNCRLFHDKEDLIVNLISTLVGVIEAKDPYTCGHSDRVALMGRRLARQLGLAEQACEDIYLAGLLHDVGKVGVSDDVLLKPGKVTPEEFAQIKRHPEIGAGLLRGLRPFSKLIPGVLHHHENLDGSGYPHGLAGEKIPLMARVLAVADAFDAMTSDRPYRDGMPLGKAEQILRDGAGKQWDPAIVDAYFAARDDLQIITREWRDHLRQVLAPQPQQRHDPVMGNRQGHEPALHAELAGV